MAKKAATETQLDLDRIGQEINVILTEIYGRYVAQGSPTKLGGLRFLDVPSAKTFAFEKTASAEGGNLLILSAPFNAVQPDKKKFVPLPDLFDRTGVPRELKNGPHGKTLRDIAVRASYDRGKAGKFFVEVTYYLPTAEWLTDKEVTDFAEKNHCNGHDAVTRILREKVLPVAGDVMAHFVELVREL